ncbi:hypothetical protein PC129_g24390 [Phytophthora cactorum]|uniref:Uncharacterized protein n=1 Tax=Phytophthora cactorum TaxID=29920 RepID=A0A8T1GZ59_9STRA|nr:hypothetical protein PC114_g9668 [Phytophthora cactorum]KAG3198219.1 hypothetical protein PC129_g24390 [Phytophthora cactorum]
MDEVPVGLEDENAERLTVGREDTVIAGVDAPLLEVVAKRLVSRTVEYLALAANYETFWLSRTVLMPAYTNLVTANEQDERKKKGLPELRRIDGLTDANADVDEDVLPERRPLRAKTQASDDEEAARRGRRCLVGEDVPSENGGNLLGYDSRSPSGVTCDPTLKVTRQEDARATRRSLRI